MRRPSKIANSSRQFAYADLGQVQLRRSIVLETGVFLPSVHSVSRFAMNAYLLVHRQPQDLLKAPEAVISADLILLPHTLRMRGPGPDRHEGGWGKAAQDLVTFAGHLARPCTSSCSAWLWHGCLKLRHSYTSFDLMRGVHTRAVYACLTKWLSVEISTLRWLALQRNTQRLAFGKVLRLGKNMQLVAWCRLPVHTHASGAAAIVPTQHVHSESAASFPTLFSPN